MRRWVIASIVVTVLALAGSLYVYQFQYDRLPDQVPTHWNIHLEPDAWMPKENILGTFLLIPAIMVGVVLLTLLLPWLSPRHFEVDPFRTVYAYCMFLATALMGYIHLVILLGSLGDPLGDPLAIGRVLVAGIFLFFALIGNVLGKVRRNFWIGVRTPWTLASEGVWNGTHRLAAWLFVAAGLIGFLAVLLGVPPVWCFFGVITVALVPVVYSLVLYKRLAREGRL